MKSKKIINIISVLLIIFSILLISWKIYSNSCKYTSIQVDKKFINVGLIRPDSLIYIRLEINNTGKRNLIIERVDAGCKCTNITLNDTLLESGQKTYLEIEYSPEIVGFFKKDIFIYANVKPSPLLITIIGEKK